MECSPYASDAAVHLVCGRVGTGKTQRLVQGVVDLLEAGADPGSMVVCAATPAAAAALASRLREEIDGSAVPRVTTMQALERELLATPAVEARTGRQGRTLLRFEESLLMEDMKISGVAPRRLAEMLRFFYRSWADLEPMEDDWFYGEEEERVYRLLARNLAYRRAYLTCEVARAAFDVVASEADALEAARYDHVVVDDYQMLSRASQCLASRLARVTLTVAGDETARVRALEEFPSPDGLRKLQEANDHATAETPELSLLSQAVTEGVNRLAADEALGGAGPLTSARKARGACEAVAFTRPEDELQGIVDAVRRTLAAGVTAESVAVVATDRRGAARIVATLAQADVPATPLAPVVVGGDVHDDGHCALARAVTLLRLAADPSDRLAWRSWCGFGDYLANSALFTGLIEEDAIPSAESLAAAAASPDALRVQEAARAEDARAQAAALLDTLAGKRGADLFAAACRAALVDAVSVPAGIALAVGEAGETADAAALCRAIEDACLAPAFDSQGVRVGLAEDFAGLGFDTVIMAGQVNGLILPRRYFDAAQLERDKRPALLAAAMARTYACAGKGASSLFFTYFTEAPLAVAESLKLKIHRVRLRGGERLCEIHPSETIRAITGVYYHD